jgi:primosomal protein N' (replication factor Y)
MAYRFDVALDVPLAGPFTYLAEQPLPTGLRVAVPFGSRQLAGVVVGAGNPELAADNLKAVAEIFGQEPLLPAEWLRLIRFTADYYHAPYGQVLFTALPTALRGARAANWPDPRPWRLSAAGRAQVAPPAHHKARHALWQALAERPLTVPEARQINAQAARLLAEWQDAGWLERAEPEWRLEPGDTLPTLNTAQAAAVDAVWQERGRFAPWLLFGITGSGKTEVYLRLIERNLAAGKQALVLVPEINLTPQLLARFSARFPGVPLAALHSQLADGERLLAWGEAQAGRAGIVIGTRLAVFTPLPKLGLIIVDEEHDGSFKQQDGVRYHARDLAVWRARDAGVPILLGSATPSLESLANVDAGRYRELRLPERAHGSAVLPRIRVLDVRRQKLIEGLSEPVLTSLRNHVRQQGLALVFINRRGFSPVLMCTECGWLSSCRHCSARLVLHLRARRLKCHHCGWEEAIPPACPDCGNQDIRPAGHGTQRLEEALERLLPEARVLRIDRDSTNRKEAWDEIYRKVHAGEVNVLVGTQMLAKGHDFPALSLVVVVDADSGLYSADYRASERLAAMLTQVAGRAGRADTPGEVLLQTLWPEHPLFAALAAGDYAGYAHTLLAERADARLPPVYCQAMLRADAPELAEAEAFLKAALELAAPPPEVSLFGPVPALMVRLARRERAQLIIESPQRSALHAFLDGWLPRLEPLARKAGRRLRYSIDIDPQEL